MLWLHPKNTRIESPPNRFLYQTCKMPVVDFWIYPPSLNIRSCLHLKTISGMHNKQDSYLGFRETLRLHLFWISAWGNFLCLQSQISLNLGDNKSNCCYCLTKSVLVLERLKRPLRIVLCMERPYNLINVLGPFSATLQSWNFMKLILPIHLVLVRQEEKAQKYFDLSVFKWNLNHSNLWSTLGATNF